MLFIQITFFLYFLIAVVSCVSHYFEVKHCSTKYKSAFRLNVILGQLHEKFYDSSYHKMTPIMS